jgi:hypothetical protein
MPCTSLDGGIKPLKSNTPKNIPIVMIIGAPRSGTSILGRVLDQHPLLSTWVEPYYIWDHHFRDAPNDVLTAEQATVDVQIWIRKAFRQYLKMCRVEKVVDKSPRNCLKLPFVRKIFPEASYIFILRDGRDTILSILSQWKRKKEIFIEKGESDQWQNRLYIFRKWLRKRPTLKFSLQSILFELGPPPNWLKKKFLNDIRWEGRFGWGPRFQHWQKFIESVPLLEFCSYQWDSCARGILDNISLIPDHQRYILKYEDFIRDPEASITNLFSYLKIELPDGFIDALPQIKSDNSNKWRKAFSSAELSRIGPIIGQTMKDIGYEDDQPWYKWS